MKISLSILHELAPALRDISADSIAARLTMGSAEIEAIEYIGQHLEQILIAEVLSVRAHPDAEKLRLVTFSTGGEAREVVCGAPNVRPGIKVAYAGIGLTLPNGLTLEAKKIRGVVSEGMLCSEVELGIGEDASGIWEASASAVVGKSLAQELGLSARVVIDVDNKSITNRPDLWGHLGFAREICALLEIPFQSPFADEALLAALRCTSQEASPVTLHVNGASACRSYFGLSIDGVTAEPSPTWLQTRLQDLGLRPINLLVDIGNYVMLETGSPLHFFDRTEIEGATIEIRSLTNSESLTLLDGSTVKLESGDTVVADSSKPLVLAGIMGGLTSGVREDTTTIFIEAASWDASWVRRCSSRLGIRTDSSMRFEKHLSSAAAKTALLRAAQMVLELCPKAKIHGPLLASGPEASNFDESITIALRPARAAQVLNLPLDASICSQILVRLGCLVTADKELLQVTVPPFRAGRDLTEEVDLIEEIGRLYGYDKVPVESCSALIQPIKADWKLLMQRKLRNFLVYRASALEVYSSPLIGEKLLQDCSWPDSSESLLLLNPLSSERDRMRSTLIPQLIDMIARNQRHTDQFRIFELGRIYKGSSEHFAEEHFQLGLACFSREENPFLDLCEIVEELFSALGFEVKLGRCARGRSPQVAENWTGMHPDQDLDLEFRGNGVGRVFSLHPRLSRKNKIRGHCALAEITLTPFAEHQPKPTFHFEKLPQFPSSEFDVSVVTKKQTPIADVLSASKKLKVPFLTSVSIVDIYAIDDTSKSVTLRHILQDKSRTLSSEDIQSSEAAIVNGLGKAGFALRS
jgi:phenylalanyl-tRNA synthetase beta chain